MKEIDWNNPHRNYKIKNLDAYYLAIDAFFEFPEIKTHQVQQLIYDEFGFDRFKTNTYMLSVLVTEALFRYLFLLNKYYPTEVEKALAQNYA